MWRLRPWRPELAREEDPPEVGSFHPLEEGPWDGRPCEGGGWPPFYLLDGRERVEGLLEGEGGQALLVTVAAGALLWEEGRMRLHRVQVERYALGWSEDLRLGGVVFRGLEAGEDFLRGMQEARRRLEARLAQDLLGEAWVVVDGPIPQAHPRLLGFIKTHWAQYLPEEAQGLLPRLGVGERTPAFRIRRRGMALATWYLRLGPGPEGLLRVEVAPEGLEEALAFAPGLFLRLAAHPAKDPRAPQNLSPVRHLEWELLRRMGSQEVLRRRILQDLLRG